MLVPNFVFSEGVDKSTEDIVREMHGDTIPYFKENIKCCIDAQKRPEAKRQNRFIQLMERFQKYANEVQERGSGKSSKDIDIKSYYDSDISLSEIYEQLIEAGFYLDYVRPDEACNDLLYAPEKKLCKNTELCNNCQFTLYFIYNNYGTGSELNVRCRVTVVSNKDNVEAVVAEFLTNKIRYRGK